MKQNVKTQFLLIPTQQNDIYIYEILPYFKRKKDFWMKCPQFRKEDRKS